MMLVAMVNLVNQYNAGAVRVAQRALQRPAVARCAVERSNEYLTYAQAGLTVGIQ